MLIELWKKLKPEQEKARLLLAAEERPRPTQAPYATRRKLTRRVVVGMLVATNFCLAPELVPDAKAFLLRVGISSSLLPGALTTIALANETAGSDAPQVSKAFGHVFAAGDVPAGQTPIFKILGVAVEYSMSTPTTWTYGINSGSMMHAQFRLSLGGNFTIPAHSELTVQVFNGGGAIAPSARTVLDISNNSDLKHVATFIDGGTGTYTSSVNDGILAAFSDNYTWADGAAGKCMRFRADYKSGAVAEGTQTGIWWIWILQDGAGNYGGIEVQGCMTIPWMNVAQVNKLWKTFSVCQLQNGASLIRSQVTARPRTQNFTWAPSTNNNVFTGPGNTIETGQAIYLTSTGALPTNATFTASFAGSQMTITAFGSGTPIDGTEVSGTGVAAGTVLTDRISTAAGGGLPWVYSTNKTQTIASQTITSRLTTLIPYWLSTTVDPGTSSTFNICTVSPKAGTVKAIDNGSGIHTATTAPFISYYSKQYFSGITGEYDFLQAGGSIAVASVSRFKMNQQYWQASLVVPYYNRALNVTSDPARTYYWNTSGGYVHHMSTTGENERIGVFPAPYVVHLFTQAASDEQTVRILGLVGGNLPVNVRDSASGQIIPFNNGANNSGVTYVGLPALKPNTRWDGSEVGIGSTSDICPQKANGFECTFDAFDNSHMPHFAMYPYLLFGSPEMAEQAVEKANSALGRTVTGTTAVGTVTSATYGPKGTGSSSGSRKNTFAGVTRTSLITFDSQTRAEGWAFRDLHSTAYLIPASHPFFSAPAVYFKDCVHENTAFFAAVASASPTGYALTNGLAYVPNGNYYNDVWQDGYKIQSEAWCLGLSGDSNSLLTLNTMIKWWSHVQSVVSAYSLAAEETLTRKANTPGAIIDDDDSISVTGLKITAWSNGSADFTLNISGSPATSGATPSIGDICHFTTPNAPSETNIPFPKAFNAFQHYYVVSVTSLGAGNWRIQLSATRGGAAIVNTDNKTNNILVYYQLSNPPATGTFSANSASGYLSNIYGSMLLAQSRGATVDSTAMTAMAARLVSDISFAADPRYAFSLTP